MNLGKNVRDAQPKHSIEIDKLGRVNHVQDFRDSQGIPDRPRSMQCDFCTCYSYRLIFSPTHPFRIEFSHRRYIEQTEDSWWGACEDCYPLWHEKRFGELAVLVKGLNPDMPSKAELFEKFYRQISEAVSGPDIEWNTGQLRPALQQKGKRK